MSKAHSFFNDAPLLRAQSSEEVERVQRRLGFPGHAWSSPGAQLTMESNACCLNGIGFFYTRQTGPLLRTADNSGSDLVLGVVLEGGATIHSVHSSIRVRAGGAAFSLPGDLVVQQAQRFVGLTVRIPVSGLDLFRLRAAPDKVRREFPRVLGTHEAQNVGNLVRFVAHERDRVVGIEGHDQTPYLSSLADSVRKVALDCVCRGLNLPTGTHDTWYAACARVDALIRSRASEKFTTEQLADHALVSVRQLYRDFEEGVGTTPRKYANRVRLQVARHQLFANLYHGGSPRRLSLVRSFPSYRAFLHEYVSEYGEHPEESLRARESLLAKIEADFRSNTTVSEMASAAFSA